MRAGLHAMLHNANPPSATSLSYDTLTKQLNLTPEQCRQLKTVLDDYARYHQDLQAQLDDWKATGKSQILKILNPDQRERFERLTELK